MEPRESFPALLQPQVTVVATLGELLATLPRLDEEMLLPVSALRLHWDLEEFTRELRGTLYGIDETSWHHNITSDGDDAPTSLSRALAAYEHTPWAIMDNVTVAAIMCQGSVFVLVSRWAELAKKATKLHNTCRRAATEAADMVVTAWARELQAEAARYGTAQENMVELGLGLGGEGEAEVGTRHEAQMRRYAMEATSEATRATMVRQQVEAALRLLERLMAACEEATAFPRELQRLLRAIEATLEGTNEASPDVLEALVAKVAEAEQLWVANARLAMDHLLGAVDDIIRFYFTDGPASPSACEVAERCQRAMEDIPRLLQPPECPQSVPKVSPVSMEPQELSPALLQPQVTVVAILGQLRATLPCQHKEMLLLESPEYLDWYLEDFTEELWNTLCTDDSWDYDEFSISSDDDSPTFDDGDSPTSSDGDSPTTDDGVPSTSGVGDPPTSLSQALAAYKSTPGVHWSRVTMLARKWYRSLDLQVSMWAELARNATSLHNTWREVATKAANKAATITARARELQAKAARYGTAQENMVELGQALGGEEGDKVMAGREAQVRRDARVAASKARRATMERQRAEAALGLLERLVAACDEATAFPRELQRRVRDIKAALKGTNEASQDVPEDLVAKVAVAKRLWEASNRLVKDHLEGTLDDITKFKDGHLRFCEVAKRCQRALEDIPRLLRPPECLRGVPKVSPVSMEPQELSPALLQPQVTVVAILDELLGTLPWLDKMWPVSLRWLCWDLEEFTRELRATLYHIDDTWRRHNVTSDDDGPLTSLSQALAACKSTPGTRQNRVTMVASRWLGWVAVLVDSWAELARKATKLRDTWREVATEVANRAHTATTRARELQAEAARYGTAQENMELGQALGGEKGDKVVTRPEAWVRKEARVAAREARRATMVRQQVEVALGLLERLVAACDEATAFPRELQRLLRDIKATLNGTNEASLDVLEDLVAKVAMAERLWEANARLVKDHLGGTLDDTIDCRFGYGPDSPHCRRVAKQCQRAMEDIPRLLRPPECPQSIPKMSPVSMEPQELSSALLQPQVTVVAVLGELLAALPRRDEEMLLMFPGSFCWYLEEFASDLCWDLYPTDGTWRCCNVTSDGDDPLTSLSRALAAYKSIPWITWDDVTMVASEWQQSVNALVNSWAELARKATELRDTCRRAATKAADMVAFHTTRARELQDEAAHDGTAQENMVELGQALGGEEGDEVVARREAWVRREARMAASEATRATMVRQRVEVALGLLEHLVAACDKATAFPRELQCRVGDIEATLKGKNEVSPDVPKDLVAKVAEAERLWEASNRLVNDHLQGTLDDISMFLFTGGPSSFSACEVAEQCQRAIEDIPRLLQPQECHQGVPKVSPVSMEPQELSPALLQPQVTMVATLAELLATLPSEDEMNLLLEPPRDFYWQLKFFTSELRYIRHCIEDPCWRRSVTSNEDDPVTFLSQALAAWESIPGTTWDRVTVAASEWLGWVNALMNRWVQLARKATELRDTCRDLATKVADMAATASAWARDLQVEAACDGTAQENMVELGQALGGEKGAKVVARPEAQVRREAMEATSEATRATMVRQQVEAALGLLECLVAACDEATAFPRELQRLLRDIKAALKGTNDTYPNFPEDLVAKVAVAERLWEANTWLVKDHLQGTVQNITDFYFDVDDPTTPRACGVAGRCQRAIEDLTRVVGLPERPQGVPKVSPVSMEPQELSPALLQPQVTVVATLGELLATLPRRDEEMNLPLSLQCLYRDLKDFRRDLQSALSVSHSDYTWWCHSVTSKDDEPVTSLSQALAAWESTPQTTWDRVTMAVSKWHRSVSVLVDSWAQLARDATKLRNTWRVVVNEVAYRVAKDTAWARALQAEAARDGTAQENMELGQALGMEEGAEVVARYEAHVSREAMVAASEATRATMERQQVEAALGLLERLVATCDEAATFPWELQCLLRDTKAALKGTNEMSPEDLVAKVAEAEQLWEANSRLAKDHLLGAVDGIKFCFTGDPSPSVCGVAERCQRATEDISRLLRPPEHLQSIPSESPVSMEPQEPSLSQLLEALVSMVATLGKVAATVTGPHRGVRRCVPPKSLHATLRNFTWSLRKTLDHPGVTSLGDRGVPSLGQALATLRATPGATWANVRTAASTWQELVATQEQRWEQLKEEATKLRDACEDAAPARARDLQDEATHRGTAGDNLAATAQQLPVALDRDEEALAGPTGNAQVAVATNEAVGEAVVATRRARAAIRRRHWAEVALEPLQHWVDACDRATEFISYTECQLRDIEASLEGTKEASPDVPEALVAKVAKVEQLWEASACLFKHHLLGTLGDIHDLLLSPYGGRGGPDGPGSHAVAERCQKAIEDIPNLLQDSDITAVTSSQQ